MDSMKSEKLKAKGKGNWDNLFQNILVHFLTTLTCVLLCSYRFWLPSLISSVESFAFVSLPRWKPLLVNAKTLFLVANLIVVFLIGDSGFRQASRRPLSSPVVDLYNQYVERSKRFRGMHANGIEESNLKDEKEERVPEFQPDLAEDDGDRKSDGGAEFEELPAEERAKRAADDLRDPKLDEGCEPSELLTEDLTKSATTDLQDPKSDKGSEWDEFLKEELTKRVEEFIARVNKRRWIESRSIP